MEIKRGIAVAAGVAIGPALVLDTEGFRIPQRFVEGDQWQEEIERLRLALKEAAVEARQRERAVTDKLGKQYGAIFGAHALLIEDPTLVKEAEGLIREKALAAEYALSRVLRRHAKALENLNQGVFAARVADLFDVEKHILRHLLGHRGEQLQHLKEQVVVLAHDLTP